MTSVEFIPEFLKINEFLRNLKEKFLTGTIFNNY